MEEEPLTNQQRKALHLWFDMVADELRNNGLDLRKTMTYPIIPTKEGVKEMIFKPILLAMYGKRSTTQLKKQKEIDAIYDVICKTFGELGITIPAFPNADEMSLMEELKKL